MLRDITTRKTNSTRKRNTLIACVAAMAISATAVGSPNTVLAQQDSDNKTETQQVESKSQQEWTASDRQATQRQSTDQQSTIDRFLASKLILCNNGQIKAAEAIAEKSPSEEVQAYARQLAEDHKTFNTLLQPMAAYGVKPTVLPSATEQTKQVDTQKAIETSRRVAGAEVTDVTNPDTADNRRAVEETSMRRVESDPLASLFNVAQEAARLQQQECEKMFERYEGFERDMAYVGSQMLNHQMMKSELTAISQTASGELKTVADKGLKIVENHLQQAVKLSNALEIMESDGHYQGKSEQSNTKEMTDDQKDRHSKKHDDDKADHDKAKHDNQKKSDWDEDDQE